MKDPGHAIIGELTLRQVAEVLDRTKKFIHYLHRCGDPAFAQLEFSSGEDADGYPFEQTVTLRRKKAGAIDLSSDHQWSITVGYEQVSSGEHDYVAVVRRDNSTAYKTRRPGPPTEVKFRLVSYWHPDHRPEQLALAAADLSALQLVTARLHAATSSLKHWVEEGLGAAVFCSTLFCRPPTELSNTALAKFAEAGLDLETLKEKLVCQKCGRRCYSIAPSP